MKIDKEKFDKLKQMDRIEYRQKVEEIKSFHETSWGLPFLKGIIIIGFFLILLIPQGYSVFGIEFVNDITNLLKYSFALFLYFAMGGFICDLTFNYLMKKKLSELEEEYFSIEVKK